MDSLYIKGTKSPMGRKEELLLELMVMEKDSPTKRITVPGDVFNHIAEYCNERQENFLVMTLNGAHEPINTRIISLGLVNRTLTHPREVFYPAVKDNAAAIVIAHNHPSGNLEPSQEDIEITRRLKQASAIMGIEILDHLIISFNGYYSFLEENKL